jgi:hypothetical protein
MSLSGIAFTFSYKDCPLVGDAGFQVIAIILRGRRSEDRDIKDRTTGYCELIFLTVKFCMPTYSW